MRVAALAAAAVAAAGCEDREVLQRQMEELRREMAQVKATSANTAVVIEDLQNKVLLLEDQVDSARTLAQRASVPAAGLPVVKVRPARIAEAEAEEAAWPGVSGGPSGSGARAYEDSEDGSGSGQSGGAQRGNAEDPVVHLQELDENGNVVGEAVPEGAAAYEPPARGTKRPVFDSRPVVLYNQSFELLKSKHHAEALEGFERFLDQYPNHDLSDNALYWMGEAYYDLQDYPKALACFQKLVALYQDGNKVPDAMLKSALCMANTGKVASARDMMDRLLSSYPTAPAAEIARRKMAELQ